MAIDENGILTFDEYAGTGPSTSGFITSFDSPSFSSVLSKDPTQVGGSEVDLLGSLTGIIKAGAPIAVAALNDESPAAGSSLQQILYPRTSTGASVPQPMKTGMNPLLKAGLLTGAVVGGVFLIVLLVKVMKRG